MDTAKLAQPTGRNRLLMESDAALDVIHELRTLLTTDAAKTSRYHVRGAIMEMEAARYRLEQSRDKLRMALGEATDA